MRNRFIIMITAALVFIFGPAGVMSQDIMEFSLREAQIYALEHNYDVVNALTDIEIAQERVDETVATGLPQISGTVSYNNYVEIPTQLIPGEFFGEEPGTFIPIQFGTQHNASLSAQVNQMIFNGQYIVGLQASQAYLSLSQTSYEKSQIEIKNMIATAYYPVIILKENQVVFDSMLVTLEDMLYETREYYNAGFVEDADVDQLELLKSDMETTLTNINNQYEIARNRLKYLMGLKADQEIDLSDNAEELMEGIDREFLNQTPFDYNDHIDFRMLERRKELADLQVKLGKTEYYPMINAFYSYTENAMRNKFNFFATDDKWYTSQIFGVQMDIPIWSSGNRRHKIQQKKLELEKLKVQEEQLKQGLSLKVRTARSEFNNAYLIYKNKEMALKNAKRIYDKTRVKYREGISTSLDLSQTYNQYLNGQIDKLTALQNLLMKKAGLEKELTKAEY